MSEDKPDLDKLFETRPSQGSHPVPTATQKRMPDEITYSPSRANNYRTIKGVAFLFYVGAVVSLAIGVLSIFGGVTAFDDYGGLSAEIFIYGFFFMTGMSISLVFVFLSESVNLFLDIEANSRQTAKTLERILRSQSPD